MEIVDEKVLYDEDMVTDVNAWFLGERLLYSALFDSEEEQCAKFGPGFVSFLKGDKDD